MIQLTAVKYMCSVDQPNTFSFISHKQQNVSWFLWSLRAEFDEHVWWTCIWKYLNPTIVEFSIISWGTTSCLWATKTWITNLYSNQWISRCKNVMWYMVIPGQDAHWKTIYNSESCHFNPRLFYVFVLRLKPRSDQIQNCVCKRFIYWE